MFVATENIIGWGQGRKTKTIKILQGDVIFWAKRWAQSSSDNKWPQTHLANYWGSQACVKDAQ